MSYHDIKVTVDHDWTPAPQVDVLLPPVTHLKQKKTHMWLHYNMRLQIMI